MRTAFIVTLLCLGASVSQIEAICSSNFGGCDKSNGLCWDTPEKTSFCTCKAGYNFQSPSTRSGSCVNINECTTGMHTCDTAHGRCVDTIGSYRCTCNSGYSLDAAESKCLANSGISGVCFGDYYGGYGGSDYYYYDDKDEANKDSGKHFGYSSLTSTCSCETGFKLKSGCEYCQDINECKDKTSMCDLVRGACHNSYGGYYCSCNNGYLLGPCGFKCYVPSKRPPQCNSTTFTTRSLIAGDSDGYNDEVSKAVLLDYITEKAAKSGTTISALQTLQYTPCSTTKAATQKFDVNNDGKTDIIVQYACVKNEWEVKDTFDKEAYWTQWTCWNECKPTCSGGIQTRSRTCKNGLVGEGICQGPATNYKTCYSGTRCTVRVRRNALTLTTTQKNDLVQAMEKYKKDQSTNGFWNAAGSHIFPRQCANAATGQPDGCCYHGAKVNFAMWHRAELFNFEEGLTKHLKDKTLGLPYWDWLSTDAAPGLVWDKTYNGKANPFANMTIRFDLNPVAYLQRSAVVDTGMVTAARNIYLNITRKLMQAHTIHEFSEELENAHNMIHVGICLPIPGAEAACLYSMSNLDYAGYDPIFFYHHTNVDRLFANFQAYMLAQKELAWTRQSALEPQQNIYEFNRPYNPFVNRSLTSFKNVNWLSTIDDLFYYEHMLGYKYDTLTVPAPAPSTSDSEKDHIPATNNNVMIMLYERSIQSNVKISYYVKNRIQGFTDFKGPCSALSETDQRFLGSVIILGTATERPWKARKPLLTSTVSWFATNGIVLGDAGFTQKSNYDVENCYTHDIGCTANCPQAPTSITNLLPSSQMMLFPRYIREDVLKFRWEDGIRMPTWTINVDSGTQWIYFWGAEAGNLVQANGNAKFTSCDSTGGVAVTCKGSCILPSGMHYFMHKDKAKCQAGLKLEILSSL